MENAQISWWRCETYFKSQKLPLSATFFIGIEHNVTNGAFKRFQKVKVFIIYHCHSSWCHLEIISIIPSSRVFLCIWVFRFLEMEERVFRSLSNRSSFSLISFSEDAGFFGLKEREHRLKLVCESKLKVFLMVLFTWHSQRDSVKTKKQKHMLNSSKILCTCVNCVTEPCVNQTFSSLSVLGLLLSAFWVLLILLVTWSWCWCQFFKTWSSLVLVRLRSISRASRTTCSSCIRTQRMFSKCSRTCCFITSVVLFGGGRWGKIFVSGFCIILSTWWLISVLTARSALRFFRDWMWASVLDISACSSPRRLDKCSCTVHDL